MQSIKNFFLILLLGTIWGLAYVFLKTAALDLQPGMQVTFRLLISSGFLALIFIRPKHIKDIKENFKPLMVLGLINFGIPFPLIAIAAHSANAGTMAVLNGISPLITLIIAVNFFALESNKFQIFGLVIGFFGLLIFTGSNSFHGDLFPLFLCLLATVLFGLSNNFFGQLRHINPFVLAILPLFFGAIFSTPLTIFELTIGAPNNFTFNSVGSVMMLGIICTGIGMIGWIYLLKKTSVIVASTPTYLVPVTGMIFGYWILLEPITFTMMLGTLLILLGVWIANYFDPRLK